jgi:hypothetical protein
MTGMRIDPVWLEEEDHHKDSATCFVCTDLMEQPTSGCPEGHAACRKCYVECLARNKECPQCRHPTDESKCVPSREPLILRAVPMPPCSLTRSSLCAGW